MYSVHFPCWEQGNVKVIISKGIPRMVPYTAWTAALVCNKLQSTRAALLKRKRQEQEVIALAHNQKSHSSMYWILRWTFLFQTKHQTDLLDLSVSKCITTKTYKQKRTFQLVRELGEGEKGREYSFLYLFLGYIRLSETMAMNLL